MKCYYCKTYNEIPEKYTQVEYRDKKLVDIKKKCPIQQKWVRGKDKACDQIEIDKYFYCDKDDNWRQVVACLEACPLKKCKQKSEIKEIFKMQREKTTKNPGLKRI